MSMPKIIGSKTTREQSITDIISSVALEETALSHILNAEGEKIQAMIKMDDITPKELLKVNDSVTNTVDAVAQLESMLMSKLKLFGDKIKPPPPIKFTFCKKDKNTLEDLNGAEFELTDSEGIVVETAISNRGLVTFKKQYAGTYTLKETKAPVGYQPNLSTYTVIITEEGIVTIDGIVAVDFIVLNIPYPTLTVYKVDSLSNPLEDGDFELEGSVYLYKETSDVNGKAIFERIMPGDYKLLETRAPSGYRKTDTIYDVFVTEEGILTVDGVEINTVTVENKTSIIS